MVQLIRGFRDILPGEIGLWQHIEDIAISLFEGFGFKEIRIPIMERTELFARSIGEDTDIVEKEMYTFPDRKGDLLTLRPEATASIVRAYIQHKLYARDPVQKLYTIGPMFRRERPQKGRYRQFYQINAEVFGIDSALIDAQLIVMLVTLLGRLSVDDAMPHINSLGCRECRPRFTELLTAFLADRSESLCTDCQRRSGKNPLRVLDCKVTSCRNTLTEAPSIIDTLCPDCQVNFETVCEALDRMKVPYQIDKRLVRGLDYYTRTTFEIQTGKLGAQNAVAGGGRYDGLVKALGGPDLPATGFAVGFDRLAEIVSLQNRIYDKIPDVYIAALGSRSITMAFEWACKLGQEDVRIEMDFSDKSLKSQMKRADKIGARYVMIVGEQELDQQVVLLRDMASKQQTTISLGDLVVGIRDIVKPKNNVKESTIAR